MRVAVGAAVADAETEQLPEYEVPVEVPLEGADEGVQVTGVDVVDDGVGRRRWLLTWRHQLLIWTHGGVFKDGSGGRLAHKSSLVREKFGRKATSSDRARCVRRSAFRRLGECGRKPAGKSKMVGKGAPLSILIKVGGCSALCVTRFVAPGHEAPFSLPQSVAFATGTVLRAGVLQVLPIGGAEVIHGCNEMGDALPAFFARAQVPPIIPEMAPCNVSSDSPMAAFVTYELPGSLLKLICN
jgi:hypothetical protein